MIFIEADYDCMRGGRTVEMVDVSVADSERMLFIVVGARRQQCLKVFANQVAT